MYVPSRIPPDVNHRPFKRVMMTAGEQSTLLLYPQEPSAAGESNGKGKESVPWLSLSLSSQGWFNLLQLDKHADVINNPRTYPIVGRMRYAASVREREKKKLKDGVSSTVYTYRELAPFRRLWRCATLEEQRMIRIKHFQRQTKWNK